jgi:hypothetical protein
MALQQHEVLPLRDSVKRRENSAVANEEPTKFDRYGMTVKAHVTVSDVGMSRLYPPQMAVKPRDTAQNDGIANLT